MSQQQVYDYLKEHPNSCARDIYTALNTSPQGVQTALRKLMDYGCICRYIDEKDLLYKYQVKE